MLVRITGFAWFVSLLAVLATLLYVYAMLPESVLVFEEGIDQVRFSREGVFYLVIGIAGVFNAFNFVMRNLYKDDNGFRAWFYFLTISLNLFVILAVCIIGIINSNERYEFTRLGTGLYISMGLFAVIAITWPVYALFRRMVSGSASAT